MEKLVRKKSGILKITRLSCLLIMLFIQVAFAVEAKSQTQRLTIQQNNATMEKVLSLIEKEGKVSFFYVSKDVDLNRKVSINQVNQPLTKVLDELFKNTKNTYKIDGKQIYILKKNDFSEPKVNQSTNKQVNKTVSGRIVDEQGEPLIGASVVIKGTTVGVTTNVNGAYSLNIPDNDQPTTLVFSYVGFLSQEVAPTGPQLDIVMSMSDKSLSEVVVVAYGTQKRESVVGSVHTVRPGELKVPSTNLSTGFAGRLAGVISVQRTGEPGADGANFWIRGISTLGAATDPLLIIDGVQATQAELNNLAPEMIENFSILKDATATALYGSRGANGVMIVNTKSGVTEGKPIINVRVEQNFNTPINTPKVVGGVEYMNLYNEAYNYRAANGGTLGTPYPDWKIAGTENGYDPIIFPNVDWYNEMFKNLSMTQNVNFNVRGGGAKADYYLGANVSHESGMLKNRSRDFFAYDNNINVLKYVFQNNVNVRLTPSTKIGLRLNVQLRDYTGPGRGSSGAVSNIFGTIMRSNPVEYPVCYPSSDPRMTLYGDFGSSSASNQIDPNSLEYTLWGGLTGDGHVNPVAEMTKSISKNFQNNVTANLNFEQKLDFITEGLNITGLASFKNLSTTEVTRTYDRYNIANLFSDDSFTLAGDEVTAYSLGTIGNHAVPILGTKYEGSGGNRSIFLQTQLNYNRTFKDVHDVQGMVVYNQSEYNINVPSDFLASLPQRVQSIAGRLSYAYDSRYLVELNFGYNGSENFAKGKRWGFFPSVAVGYNISEEKYFQPLKPVVSNLKIRSSLGKVGNDKSVERFIYLSKVTLQSSDRSYTTGYDMGTTLNGPKYDRFQNNDITWEVGLKFDVGIDLQLFKHVNIMLDFFTEERNSIFKERGTIPTFMGTAESKIYGNLASVKNIGTDMAVNYDRQITKDFFLSLRGTFTFARNTVLSEDEPVYAYYPNLSRVGHQINQNLIYVADGLFKDWADIASSPNQSFGTVAPGDIKYKDIADIEGFTDDKINTYDRIYTGYPTTPEIVYGFGASAKYKNIDASLFFQGTERVSLLMSGFHPFATSGSRNMYNVLAWVADDYWSEANPNPNAQYPALSVAEFQNTTIGSTFWLRDASFLKLKNAEIGYTYKFVRIYASGSNLLTFSKFKLWDPEQGGGSGYKYPNQRVFNLGFQMNF